MAAITCPLKSLGHLASCSTSVETPFERFSKSLTFPVIRYCFCVHSQLHCPTDFPRRSLITKNSRCLLWPVLTSRWNKKERPGRRKSRNARRMNKKRKTLFPACKAVTALYSNKLKTQNTLLELAILAAPVQCKVLLIWHAITEHSHSSVWAPVHRDCAKLVSRHSRQ